MTPPLIEKATAGGAPRPALPRRWVLLGAPILLGLGVAGLWKATSSGGPGASGPWTPPPYRTGPGFQDRRAAAGIDFHMTYLPAEQGEQFKVNLYDHGSGVAVADIDGDGDEDVYFLNQLGPNALDRNDGHGRFTDVTQAAGDLGLDGRISVAACFADVDGDGDEDLYVTTTRGGNVFFRNRGDGTFVDDTKAAGLELVAHSQTPIFFDADGDGDLDLLVTNTAKWTTEQFDEKAKYYRGPPGLVDMVLEPIESDRYYRNRGDGTFEDATEASGLGGTGWGGDAAVFDYDEDGDLDVFVGNMFGRSHLLQNDGKGHFHEVTGETLGKTSWGTMGARVFDYDGDGRLDLLLVDMHSDMWMAPTEDVTRYPETRKFPGFYGPTVELGLQTQEEADAHARTLGFRVENVVYGNTLFHNLGGGRFEEVSDRAGLETLWPWGIATADFDGDGFEDVYLASGMGFPFRYWRSPLLMNQGDGTFVDRCTEAGIDPLPGGSTYGRPMRGVQPTRSSRSAATADFDGDGRVDLVVNNFNDVPFLYMNGFPERSWLALRLTGAGNNRDAIGAVVRLEVGGRTLVRQVGGNGGYLAQSSKTVVFGLGEARRVDRCEIRWPDRRVQVLPVPSINRRLDVTEPAASATPR